MGRGNDGTQTGGPQGNRMAGRRLTAAAVCMGAVILTGELVPGVECPGLRTDDGKVVALSHLPGAFETGDRITVTGSGYGASMSCQQEVFLVETAEPAK